MKTVSLTEFNHIVTICMAAARAANYTMQGEARAAHVQERILVNAVVQCAFDRIGVKVE